MAVFLATDHYDYIPGTFSATKLLKPIRQLILTPRVPPELQTADLEDLVASRMGTAIHSGIELAWSPENFPKAMEKLGYSPDLIAKVKTAHDTLRETLKGNDTAKIKADTEALTKPLYELSAELYKQAAPNGAAGGAAGAAGAAGTGAGAGAGSSSSSKKDDDNVVDAEVVDDDKK